MYPWTLERPEKTLTNMGSLNASTVTYIDI